MVQLSWEDVPDRMKVVGVPAKIRGKEE